MNSTNSTSVISSDEGIQIQPQAFVANLSTLSYQQDILCIEDVDVDSLVQTYGTPLYVYSKQAILGAYQDYDDSFAAIDHQICYSVKANSNLSVLQILVQAGASFDIVSVGELQRVLAAGGDASKVVYSGVGKTQADIKAALEAGIGCFNVESVTEIERIQQVAKQLDKVAHISVRVNPNVDAGTHPYISTGLRNNKFGIAHEDAVAVYQQAAEYTHIQIVGIDCHIGSQLTKVEPFIAALDKVIELIDALQQIGISLQHIDLGGGLGVRYIDETPVKIADFAAALLPKLQALKLKVFLEPGRSIVANAGVLLTKVDVLKPSEHKNFAVVDAAMNDLIRPALYQAQMAVLPTVLPDNAKAKYWDIVGAVCETGDFLAKQRHLSLIEGDILAITGAGAYGFVMSSNYNTRPRAAEVMVSEDTHKLIRVRETVEQLLDNEKSLLSLH
ncbi:diaminopimelate decarboxylase [Psychrobacter sp. I-STPA10]|uniref:diaminopimelate decarboxylase n=1 Tax=Psychrobacter sp. I-STPA10 TaxID=2585769 RepID=UPI001E435041|nr:diaminopimelate decarboxylase [Psychrobacter sp. I-STPA10]